MTTPTPTDTAKHLTLIYRITSPAQQTRLLAEGQWVASAHSDVLAERDELQRQAQQLQDRVQDLELQLQAALTVVGANAQIGEEWAERAKELERQLDAVGAGGVEPLRKRRALTLHTSESRSSVMCRPWNMLWT